MGNAGEGIEAQCGDSTAVLEGLFMKTSLS